MKKEYLLRGLIRCGLCGKEPCTASVVRAEELDALVWQDIMSFVRNPGPLVRELENRVKQDMDTTPTLTLQVADLDRDIRAKARERERIITLYRKGTITDEDVNRELAALGQELKLLEDQQTALIEKQQQRLELGTQAATARILLESLRDKAENATFETKRELVLSLVEKIVVDTVVEEGKKVPKVTIKYRFPCKDTHGGGLTDCVSRSLEGDNITVP